MSDATPATPVPPTPGGFLEKLRRRWRDGRTLLCIGLDLELERLPTAHGHDVESAFFQFNAAIIDATADLVCAYKPNAAFYERHGAAGWNALAHICTQGSFLFAASILIMRINAEEWHNKA